MLKHIADVVNDALKIEDMTKAISPMDTAIVKEFNDDDDGVTLAVEFVVARNNLLNWMIKAGFDSQTIANDLGMSLEEVKARIVRAARELVLKRIQAVMKEDRDGLV